MNKDDGQSQYRGKRGRQPSALRTSTSQRQLLHRSPPCPRDFSPPHRDTPFCSFFRSCSAPGLQAVGSRWRSFFRYCYSFLRDLSFTCALRIRPAAHEAPIPALCGHVQGHATMALPTTAQDAEIARPSSVPLAREFSQTSSVHDLTRSNSNRPPKFVAASTSPHEQKLTSRAATETRPSRRGKIMVQWARQAG